uniref:Molybdate-anion transporter n=1 Tax=Plectus sambesii TaxID=2011161 RepID=A0A914XK42_9BILA
MADFNSFAYGLCLMSTLISLAVYWLLERAKRRPTGWTQTNSEFRSFQLNFLCGYLPCLFADSLQAPYLYYLYQSYGFLESQIAILYVTGFATNVVCSVVSVHLVQRYERRVLCLA